MNTKAEPGPGTLDTVKLFVAALLMLGGIVAYYLFADVSVVVRVLAMFGGLAAGVAIAFQSTQGRQLWQFIQGSRVELRKVVWPTQQETMQTTMMVVVFAVLLAFFFFLVDLLLLKLTQFLTGQGG
ncbi:MAG: preprotein translocase subunit SecE [Gammaproteobacteria bacterium]|nr:MAG: preprotein translocase subunit SecE [Gammaproteobacteria bacterium]